MELDVDRRCGVSALAALYALVMALAIVASGLFVTGLGEAKAWPLLAARLALRSYRLGLREEFHARESAGRPQTGRSNM